MLHSIRAITDAIRSSKCLSLLIGMTVQTEQQPAGLYPSPGMCQAFASIWKQCDWVRKETQSCTSSALWWPSNAYGLTTSSNLEASGRGLIALETRVGLKEMEDVLWGLLFHQSLNQALFIRTNAHGQFPVPKTSKFVTVQTT